jgi:hypothetical protein
MAVELLKDRKIPEGAKTLELDHFMHFHIFYEDSANSTHLRTIFPKSDRFWKEQLTSGRPKGGANNLMYQARKELGDMETEKRIVIPINPEEDLFVLQRVTSKDDMIQKALDTVLVTKEHAKGKKAYNVRYSYIHAVIVPHGVFTIDEFPFIDDIQAVTLYKSEMEQNKEEWLLPKLKVARR